MAASRPTASFLRPEEVFSQLQKGPPYPLYLFHGDEPYLVDQAVYFAAALRVPSSLMGLILLSLGTNVPELVIAARSILKQHKEIAFGDYVGSAAANTLIFGFLPLGSGVFLLERQEFLATGLIMLAGTFLLYLFAQSRQHISRKEGCVLLLLYIIFLITQFVNVLKFTAS